MNRDVEQVYGSSLSGAAEFITGYDDFLVVAHLQPDGDAIASTLAMGWVLKQLGKSYRLVNEDSMPEKFHLLPGIAQVNDRTSLPQDRKFQHVITLDCADFSRVGSVRDRFADDAHILNIDHHPTNDRFGTHHLIQPTAAATVEIVYDLAVHLNLKLGDDFANLIYAGLLTDTGGFRYSSTSSKVMHIAADLLDLGARGSELAECLLERMTIKQMSMLQKALPALSFSEDHKIAWIVVSSELMDEVGANSDDLDGLINYPRSIEGIEVGMLLKQRDSETYKVSLRSTGTVDVAIIAKHYGGGGHVKASGCTMNGRAEDIIDQLLEEVGKQLQ